jgi:GDPmannose 4,6-dehydratase
MSFAEVGAEIEFKGEGVNETGVIVSCINDYHFKPGQQVVKIDPRYFRPTEVELLIGDPTKANQKLGWKPKYDLKALVAEMVAADVQSFKQEKLLIESGFQIARQWE